MAATGSPAARTPKYITQEIWVTAPFGRRLAAWLLDMTLLVIVALVVAAALGLTQTKEVPLSEQEGSIVTTVSYVPTQWYYALIALASALYAIPLWRLNRATLAQHLMDLRVVDVEPPKALSWRQAALRWLILFGWVFPGIGSGYGAVTWFFTLPFWAWFVILIATAWRDLRGQGIHDRLAGSLVEKRRLYTVVGPKPAAVPIAPPTFGPSSGPTSAPRRPAPTGANRGPRRSTTARRGKD